MIRKFCALLAALAALGSVPGPAQAAVNAGQVLVKADALAPVEAAVAGWLERFAGRDDARTHDLWMPREAARRVVVLPPVDGWVLVLEGVEARADEGLARHLAATLETEAIWIEVAGSRLAWRHARWQGERRLEVGAEPAEAFAEPEARDGALPAYVDAEKRAWDWLAARGVPAAHRLVHAGDLQRARPDDEAGVEAAVLRVARAGEALEVMRDRARLRPPTRRDAPPVDFDTLLPGTARPQDGDPGKAIDLIRLVGEPTEEGLDRLVEVFGAIRARYTAGGRRFYHLVEDRYRVPVYARLAREEGPCAELYGRMLERARSEAEEGAQRPTPPGR